MQFSKTRLINFIWINQDFPCSTEHNVTDDLFLLTLILVFFYTVSEKQLSKE